MEDRCFCHFNGFQVKDAVARAAIESISKIIPGIRRKVNAHSGALENIVSEANAEKGKRSCTVYAIAEDGTSVDLLLGSEDAKRRIRISTNPGITAEYQITRLSGYGVANLYSPGSSNKQFLGVWLDGTKYDSLDVLKDANLAFESMVILYTVNAGEYTINTCLTVNARGFRVYESIPEDVEIGNKLVKSVMTSSYITNLYTETDNHSVFIINQNPEFLYIEKIEDLGKTVIKTVDFNGGL